MRMPQTGEYLFPRVSSNMNDLDRISTLRSIQGYVVSGLFPGYVARYDASGSLVGHVLTLSELWCCIRCSLTYKLNYIPNYRIGYTEYKLEKHPDSADLRHMAVFLVSLPSCPGNFIKIR